MTVDGPISDYLGWLFDMTISMLIKFASVIIVSPIFMIPGVLVSVLGAWCGQIYIKSQLSVKREMSNARAPVLGHFGAAIAGLSEGNVLLGLIESLMHFRRSVHPCLRCGATVQR